ncbi:STAM-binding protein-like [Gigantopelta aegis]|uniref:STAM-binding protein-like n=1 Tax=Gigantopelta aegis TaxID=1735272 RepID=UPI001B88B9D0|nr:STAM-binding protein-like [Gigantopelta aegis]
MCLFIERLPSHPDYRTVSAKDVAEVKKKVKQVFPLAEEIKSKLKHRYKEEQKMRQEVEKKRQAELDKEEEKRRQEEDKLKLEELAILEQKKLESEEQWMREQEERYHELQEQERRKASQTDEQRDLPTNNLSSHSGLNNERPAVPSGTLEFVPNDLGDMSLIQPSRQDYVPPQVPDRELKKNLTINDIPGSPSPSVDRSTKPALIDHFTSPFGGSGLRQVTVPKDLISQFTAIAQPNTDKNVETLGILFGSLAQNAFHITDLFIPHQTGTPDSCDMEFEEDLIDYQDKLNLITLGWIHTHPTQTAFLSSVDLHSQFPYQKMLPEAIAIVYSPKFQETGIFRLTSDRGLDTIGRCKEKGFHYHAKEPPLFENCDHVTILENKKASVSDYRRK